MDLGYYVLYLHHGFGNKRIVRLERTINEYLERAQTEKEMKTETLAELLKVRYDIDVQKEINLIPMQQLIRIYQRNNPLTINDTRQLLNDTAYRVVEFDKYAIASYNAVHGTDFPTMDITKVHAENLNICDTNAFTYLLTYLLTHSPVQIYQLPENKLECLRAVVQEVVCCGKLREY